MRIKDPLRKFSVILDMIGFDLEGQYYQVDIQFVHLPRSKLKRLEEFLTDEGYNRD